MFTFDSLLIPVCLFHTSFYITSGTIMRFSAVFFRGLLQGVPGGHWAFFPRVVRHLKRRVWEGGGASQMEMVVLRVYESRVVEVYEMRWASIF